MRCYRTEIVIPADRLVSLQLPFDFPEGHAIVAIEVQEPDQTQIGGHEVDPDQEDIEWWEEFESGVERASHGGPPEFESTPSN